MHVRVQRYIYTLVVIEEKFHLAVEVSCLCACFSRLPWCTPWTRGFRRTGDSPVRLRGNAKDRSERAASTPGIDRDLDHLTIQIIHTDSISAGL